MTDARARPAASRLLPVAGVTSGRPPSTPHCLMRRETGLHRDGYRAVCLAVRSVCGGRGRRRLVRQVALADAADAEYNVERLYLHVPARKAVMVAAAFGPLDLPSSFQPFFRDMQRKDDRCTTLAERPHPYLACRPLAFSLHRRHASTELEEVDIRRRQVTRRVTLAGPGPGGFGAAARPPPAFKYIHHDLERNELVITSVQTEEVLASVIIFSMWPLQFLAHFKVKRRDFPLASSVCAGEGVLMLTCSSRGSVLLYSLDAVLQERSFVAKLGDDVTVDGRRYVVGQHPYGLPINAELRADAPPLAAFPARQGYLEIGATPYHVVTRGKRDGFEVRTVSDERVVLTCDSLRSGPESESGTFIDDGPFLVQYSTSDLRVFDLRSGQVVLQVDPTCFSDSLSSVSSGPTTTRSGRSVRVRSREDYLSALSNSEWWLAWDLEDELDLIVVVIVEEEAGEAAVLRRVLMFDRLTWTMTSDTPVRHRMPLAGAGLAQLVVVMDRCLLFIKLRSTASKCATLVYNVTAWCEPEQPTPTQVPATSAGAGRRRARRGAT